MCGIAGGRKAQKINSHQTHRGESQKTLELNNSFNLAHTLHSIVGNVEQPLKEDSTFLVANCEIYNWEELAKQHGIDPENDAELLHKLLNKKGIEILEQLDGVYAFAYLKENELILARDKLGVKPIWYTSNEEDFHFASEKQALENEGFESKELHPRKILKYNLNSGKITFNEREFFEINTNEDKELEETAREVKELFINSVEKRIPENKDIGVLFSGGLDSTLVAAALKHLDKDFTCYTAGIQHGNVNAPRDVEWAEKVAEQMNLDLKTYNSDIEEVEETLPKISNWLSTTSTVKLGVSLPFHFSLKQGNEKVVFSGLGSEQLYAGYHRHQGYLNKECLSGLRNIFHRDLYRDDVIAMRNRYELRIPFLDQELVEHSLQIPEDYKTSEDYKKYVLRKAAELMDVPEEVIWRKKTAAQYGSNFDKAINRISKNKDFSHKQEYLNSLRDSPNNRLIGLTSGGKDSCAAIYRMQRRNNAIKCLLNIQSENRESYMFDVKKKEQKIIRKQAEDFQAPLIVRKTKGMKEKEVDDLKDIIHQVQQDYNVEGLITGALASTYQRDRIEKIAEKTGLKVFSPLWQENPKNYMRWLVRTGFKVEITEVAARGLTQEWEGTILNENNLEDLLELSEEYRFNAAGEGGEYETIVKEIPN